MIISTASRNCVPPSCQLLLSNASSSWSSLWAPVMFFICLAVSALGLVIPVGCLNTTSVIFYPCSHIFWSSIKDCLFEISFPDSFLIDTGNPQILHWNYWLQDCWYLMVRTQHFISQYLTAMKLVSRLRKDGSGHVCYYSICLCILTNIMTQGTLLSKASNFSVTLLAWQQ